VYAADDKKPEEAETVVIPLDEIWGWEIQGTRNVLATTSDDSQQKQAKWTMVESICNSLHPLGNKGESEPAFMVQSVGLKALKNAHAVRTNEKKSRKSFPSGTEVSIFFFSHALNPYVRLCEVRLRGSIIEIKYCFVPTIDAGQTVHWALIPMRNLKPGEYQVKVMRQPSDKEFTDWGIMPLSKELTDKVVCKSFRFTIDDAKTD